MRLGEQSERRGGAAFLPALALVLWTPLSAMAQTQEIDGFTEPYETINVAAADSGIIDQLNVREGQAITQGQILASLDCQLFYRSLAIAEESMKAKGKLVSAKAHLALSQDRLKRFEDVLATGHARHEEVAQARTEVEMAEGNLLAVEEDLRIKALEYERIKAQIKRRRIRSPIDGYVRRIVKNKGEYAAPNDPTVMVVVQLNRLLATFSVPSAEAREMRLQQAVLVELPNQKESTKGVIEVIDPVTDAESGSVLVKVRIDNDQGRYRSGERCILRLGSDAKVSQARPAKRRAG